MDTTANDIPVGVLNPGPGLPLPPNAARPEAPDPLTALATVTRGTLSSSSRRTLSTNSDVKVEKIETLVETEAELSHNEL
jgi:hypothetical protein